MIQIPDFKTKAELFAHLKANKELYISAKKSQTKNADAVDFHAFVIDDTGTVQKLLSNPELLNLDEFNVKAAINTTNIMDSHSDVHLPGIWTKSLKERKGFYLLQEHKMQFDKIISDNVKASVKTMTWKELGQDYPGSTEVLVFDATIEKGRNEYMAEQYAKGRVKNHSVGMQYVKLELAINSDDKYDAEEKAVWDKYISQVVNKSDADAQGYFWAVTEAKIIEGSAVPMGSNYVTPTISIGEKAITLNTAENITDEVKPLQWSNVAEAIKQSFKN
jgi:hypothetical protein